VKFQSKYADTVNCFMLTSS